MHKNISPPEEEVLPACLLSLPAPEETVLLPFPAIFRHLAGCHLNCLLRKAFFLSARREEASPHHFIPCVQRSAPRRIPESIQTGQSNMCARPCGHTANPFRSAHTESRNALIHFCHPSVLVNEIPGTAPGPARFHHTSACRGTAVTGTGYVCLPELDFCHAGETATSRGNKPSDRINPFLLCGSRAEENHPGQLPLHVLLPRADP